MQWSYGVIELALVFGAVLALAVWELISVRRAIRRDRTDRRRDTKP
jgi:hypothetical protein